MSRIVKKKKEDIGLSPYALVFRGQNKVEKTIYRVIESNSSEVNEFNIKTLDELKALKNKKVLSWLNVDGLHESKNMEDIASIFKIPANIISDIMNPSLRPKVQLFENGVFLTIKMLQYKNNQNFITDSNLSVIILDNLLISFQEETANVFDPIRERIRKHNNRIRISGADYLAFGLLDIVVDNYIFILGALGEQIEILEEKMTNDPKKELLDEVNIYKRELNFLRKKINPAKEMILALTKLDTELIKVENKIHYKELQDNIAEATEFSDSYREMLYDQITIYHTTMSTKLNDIMRTLTVFSVIFIPLTFIVGVYGTNFEYLPELKWHSGYFIMWGFMIILTILMLWIFKKKKWF